MIKMVIFLLHFTTVTKYTPYKVVRSLKWGNEYKVLRTVMGIIVNISATHCKYSLFIVYIREPKDEVHKA